MKNVIWFTLGAIVGAAGGYYYAYRKAETRADEEIDEMREYYRDKINAMADKEEQPDPNPEKESSPLEHVVEQRKSVEEEITEAYEKRRVNYGKFFTPLNAPPQDRGDIEQDPYKDKEMNAYGGIYLIAPEEFGREDGYSEVSLTWYEGDKVLADEEDDPVDNISEAIGEVFMGHFGDFQEGVCHVRNENTMTDYEITLDERSYDAIYPERHIHELEVDE